MPVNIDLLRQSIKAEGKPARWVRIGMNNPERLVRSPAAEKEDRVPRACDRARVNPQAARIAQLGSQLRGFVFDKRIGKFVTLQTIQKRGVHQLLLQWKGLVSKFLSKAACVPSEPEPEPPTRKSLRQAHWYDQPLRR